jgi:hypothetical protein
VSPERVTLAGELNLRVEWIVFDRLDSQRRHDSWRGAHRCSTRRIATTSTHVTHAMNSFDDGWRRLFRAAACDEPESKSAPVAVPEAVEVRALAAWKRVRCLPPFESLVPSKSNWPSPTIGHPTTDAAMCADLVRASAILSLLERQPAGQRQPSAGSNAGSIQDTRVAQ